MTASTKSAAGRKCVCLPLRDQQRAIPTVRRVSQQKSPHQSNAWTADTYSHPVAGGGVDGAKRNGEPAEVATIRGASAGAKAGQTCHCGLAGHALGMIGPFGHAQRPREAAAGEIPAPQSHRRLHQAVSAEQSPTVRRFTVAPRIPLSGDCSLVAQLRGAGRLVGAALRFFSIRHQPLFHAASVAHSGVRVLSKQRG